MSVGLFENPEQISLEVSRNINLWCSKVKCANCLGAEEEPKYPTGAFVRQVSLFNALSGPTSTLRHKAAGRGLRLATSNVLLRTEGAQHVSTSSATDNFILSLEPDGHPREHAARCPTGGAAPLACECCASDAVDNAANISAVPASKIT